MARAVAIKSETHTGLECRRWPLPAGRPPKRTRSQPGVRALHRARSRFPEPEERLPAFRGPPESDARVFPGIRGSQPISFVWLRARRRIRGLRLFPYELVAGQRA